MKTIFIPKHRWQVPNKLHSILKQDIINEKRVLSKNI